jgi:hypothetical protein
MWSVQVLVLPAVQVWVSQPGAVDDRSWPDSDNPRNENVRQKSSAPELAPTSQRYVRRVRTRLLAHPQEHDRGDVGQAADGAQPDVADAKPVN